jgi:hypothetical protein
MKKIILFTVVNMMMMVACVRQPSKLVTSDKYHFIDNLSLKFQIVRVSEKSKENGFICYKGTYVITELSIEERRIVKSIDKKTWLSLLNDPNKDWAANLLLYELHGKFAGVLTIFEDSRDKWVNNYGKAVDIADWKKFL